MILSIPEGGILMPGKVEYIFVAERAGAFMQLTHEVRAVAGRGLSGDRYACGRGAFSHARKEKIRHVTLIATEAIEEASAVSTTPFPPCETRRNIVTRGVDLNALVGIDFSVGNVRMRGVEFADPCSRPGKLADKADFEECFAGRGGLRAEILSSGHIRVGDSVSLLLDEDT